MESKGVPPEPATSQQQQQVVILKYEDLLPQICQNSKCHRDITRGDIALDTHTGLKYHYRCFLTAGESEKAYRNAVLGYLRDCRWRRDTLALGNAQRAVCERLANRWRFLWLAPSSQLAIRFTPWSVPLDQQLAENFSLQWTAAAAQKLVWPDSASFNATRSTAVVQHLFPVGWFTEGAAHWTCQLKQTNGDTATNACQLAGDLLAVLQAPAKNLRLEVSTWTLDRSGSTLVVRVGWSALTGSTLHYQPIHKLADGSLYDQAAQWQQFYTTDIVKPLVASVGPALQKITAVYPTLQLLSPWAPSGLPQLKAQFTRDEGASVTVWAGIVPHPPTSQTHYVLTDTDGLHQVSFAVRRQKPQASMPYHVAGGAENLCVDDMSTDVAQQTCTRLIRVDPSTLKKNT